MTAAVSLISVCFRNPQELDRTLSGLTGLDRDMFEVVIVDGSPDESCSRIARNYPHFRHLHGPDSGKYDAMNKGILAASGAAVLFMNSGDELAEPERLEAAVRSERSRLPDTIIYGDCVRVVASERICWPAPDLTPENLRLGVLPSHQSILIPTAYHRANLYDPDMFFAADTKFLKKAFDELPRLHWPFPIGTFHHGGACTSPGSWRLLTKQYRELCDAHELRPAERVREAGRLVRRKLAHMVIGEEGLQKMQARRLRRSVRRVA